MVYTMKCEKFCTIRICDLICFAFYTEYRILGNNCPSSPIDAKNIDDAAEIILKDRKHLDNNPREISKNDITVLLEGINNDKINQLSS